MRLSRRRSRPGAQDRFLRSGFFILLLAALVGALLILDKGRFMEPFKQSLREVSSPGLVVLSKLWHGVRNLAGDLAKAPSLGKQVRKMEEEAERMGLVETENLRLKIQLADLREALRYQAGQHDRDMVSNIVAVDPEGWYRSVWIDRGLQDGLRPGTICWTPQGLAGRLVRIDRTRSQMMVLTDPDFRVSAVLADSRLKGFVRGRGGPELDFVSLEKNPEFRVGEWVYSSGLGGLFPPDIVLGQITGSREGPLGVSEILTLLPAVRPPRLERVFLKIPQQESAEAVR